jgi:hypothetical protein
MASRPSEFILYVHFEEREDGGLRARCPNVPNFFLSHSDPELVKKDVEPALSTILSEMYGVAFEVRRVPELAEALEDQIPLPHICAQSYLGSRIDAR